MYPFIRMAYAIARSRNAPPLPVTGTHVSHHLCLPWDLDFWSELNNGRTLTLYDLGRMPMLMRMGLTRMLRGRRIGMTIAGSSVRYRRRVRLFHRVEMRSRCIGWDARFLYMDQSMWRNGECTSQVLIRSAFTDGKGIVPPAQVLALIGRQEESPPLPGWVQAWIAADAQRPWPPQA
ncbi:MAG: acyl-CoA thioesterase [Defluviimonas sp.]|nr:acyl-CoA thioesterase [Defluviimonas sp.]